MSHHFLKQAAKDFFEGTGCLSSRKSSWNQPPMTDLPMTAPKVKESNTAEKRKVIAQLAVFNVGMHLSSVSTFRSSGFDIIDQIHLHMDTTTLAAGSVRRLVYPIDFFPVSERFFIKGMLLAVPSFLRASLIVQVEIRVTSNLGYEILMTGTM